MKRLADWISIAFHWVVAFICGKDKLPSVRVLMAVWMMFLVTKIVNRYLELINHVNQVDSTILWMLGMIIIAAFMLIGLVTWQNLVEAEKIAKGQINPENNGADNKQA